MEGTGTGVNGQSSGRRLCISLGKQPTIFQAEVYAILVCVYEIQTNAKTGDSQVDLEALQAPKTMSPLVQQCQKALNDNSTWYMENGY